MEWLSRSKPEQERRDEQIELNKSAGWRSAHLIATKIEKLPP